MIIEKLVALSNLYGSNEELVLAGGGNTSAKDGDIMYVKGSGTQLATITEDGFVKMSRTALAEIFTKEYPTDDKEREAQALADLTAAKLPGQENKRPSVETLLHSLFDKAGVDADRSGLVFHGLVTDHFDLLPGGVCFQQGVVYNG